MSTPAFLQAVVFLLMPFRFLAENEEYLANLAASIGWDIDEVVGFDADAAAADMGQIADGVDALIQHIATPPDSISKFVTALDDAEKTFTALRDLARIFGGAGGTNLDDFGKALLEALIIATWYRRSPVTLSLAEILGLVTVPDDGPLMPAIRDGERLIRVEHRRGELHFNRIGPLLRNPVGFLDEEYFAGDALATTAGAHQAADKLFPRLARLAILLGFDASYGFEPEAPVTGGPAVVDRLAHMLTLFLAPNDADVYGFTLALSSEDRGRRGLLIRPFGAIQYEEPVWDWNLRLTGSGAPNGLLLGPASVEVIGGQSWRLDLALERNSEMQPGPATVGGEKTGLTVGKVRIEGGLALGEDTREASLDLVVEDAHFSVAGSEGDGFLADVIPPDGLSADINFAVGWSSATGFHFSGSGALQAAFPVHVQVGPVKINSFSLEVKTDGSAIGSQVSFNAGLVLGPLAVTIDGIGLDMLIDFPEGGGNLGVADLDLHFKPPNGLGLSVDGGGFKGGGFLDFEPGEARYSGMLELEFQDQFTLKAFGLLNTRLPNGQSGFSLLIVISSEFTPIQLGLGFKLNGVGGLLGLNRTINIEPLRTGLRDHTLSSILFPTDIVANADRIISDLRQVFPPLAGRFIFGPMAKIAWGTPTLLTVDLGLVIEVPEPVRLALLGVLRAVLPDEKAAILRVQVNFLGELNFERRQLKFDASLFDSKLLGFTLSGDMALRLDWGADANFLLTVGGFHPAYQPPAMELPAIRRLTLSLLEGDNPRLKLELYFAVTSNTAQFGARLELYAAAWKFNVYGFLSFDVLFQFNPFYFIAEITAMLALRVGSSSFASIKLTLTLEGPTPWKAQGTARFKICWFFTLKVRFNKTFGESRNTTLPDVAVLPLLAAALGADDNWEGELPSQRRRLESIRETPGELLVHPVGTLKVSQKVAPLNVRIDRLGSQRPSDAREFQITDVQPEANPAAVQESFAPAQFFDMTDEEKLTSASFKSFASGVRVGDAERLQTGYAAVRRVQYELKYIDSQREQRLVGARDLFEVDGVAFNRWTLQGAIAHSPLSFARNRKSVLAPAAVAVTQETFAIVNRGDLRLFDELSVLGSERAAAARLHTLLEENPNLRGTLQVVPAFELAA